MNSNILRSSRCTGSIDNNKKSLLFWFELDFRFFILAQELFQLKRVELCLTGPITNCVEL